jgi:hypothetical protein
MGLWVALELALNAYPSLSLVHALASDSDSALVPPARDLFFALRFLLWLSGPALYTRVVHQLRVPAHSLLQASVREAVQGRWTDIRVVLGVMSVVGVVGWMTGEAAVDMGAVVSRVWHSVVQSEGWTLCTAV